MGTTAAVAFLLVASLAVSAAGGFPFPFFHGRPAGGFVDGGARRVHGLNGVSHLDVPDYPGVTLYNFTQQIVHGNTSAGTFQQRYWYNQNYVNKNLSGPSDIVFLMIQGEGVATDRWAGYSKYQYLQMAADHGAHAFQLEHRCFGWTRPKNDLTVETLEYCHIEDAIEDIAEFIKAMNTQYNFNSPRWITFGGSYPGILSALFRQAHPELTKGAVASSAPLHFTFDMWQYAVSMEETFNTIPGCSDNIRAAFTLLQQKTMTVAGRTDLNNALHLQPPFTANSTQLDIDNFFANVFAAYQDIVQYTFDGRNDDTKTTRNINTLCTKMTAALTDTFPNSYADLITTLRNTTFDDENPDFDQASNRGWLWLQCQQLGVQQTTDQGRSIFGQTVPVNYFLYMCRDGFPETNDATKSHLSAGLQHERTTTARKKYGNGNFDATNVILPNGSFDPWHKGGLYRANHEKNIYPILINGTAHCADMYEEYAGEPADLAGKRQQIKDLVTQFLNS